MSNLEFIHSIASKGHCSHRNGAMFCGFMCRGFVPVFMPS